MLIGGTKLMYTCDKHIERRKNNSLNKDQTRTDRSTTAITPVQIMIYFVQGVYLEYSIRCYFRMGAFQCRNGNLPMKARRHRLLCSFTFSKKRTPSAAGSRLEVQIATLTQINRPDGGYLSSGCPPPRERCP